MNRVFQLFLITIWVVWCSASFADDWPQYRGLLGDGKSLETISVPIRVKPIWKVSTPLGFSSFSIAGGRAFTIATDAGKNLEECLAFDASTGDALWRRPLGSNDYEDGGGNSGAPGNRGGDGPRSTPSSDGERVYVYDSYLLLTCFDAETGDIVWQHDIVKDFAGQNIKWLNATSPLLDGDKVYVSGGGPGQSCLAFQASSGELIWKSGDEVMTHATPHLMSLNGKKQVIFFMRSGLIGVDAETGKERWRRKFKFSVSTAASPITEGNRVYCSAGYGVGAGLFEVTSKSVANKIWLKPNKLMNHWSTPVVSDGHIYGIFEFKKYGKAPLQCVEMGTGEIKWAERGFGPGNCILVGDKLVVLSDTGELVIAGATPTGYQELSRSKVIDGKCWSTPAFSNGRVYVRSTTEGVCVELNAS